MVGMVNSHWCRVVRSESNAAEGLWVAAVVKWSTKGESYTRVLHFVGVGGHLIERVVGHPFR